MAGCIEEDFRRLLQSCTEKKNSIFKHSGPAQSAIATYRSLEKATLDRGKRARRKLLDQNFLSARSRSAQRTHAYATHIHIDESRL